MDRSQIIAVDFDGTLCFSTNRFDNLYEGEKS